MSVDLSPSELESYPYRCGQMTSVVESLLGVIDATAADLTPYQQAVVDRARTVLEEAR